VQRSILILSSCAALVLCSCHQPIGPPSVSGTIETDEAHVASRYGGRVERIFAWEGDLLTNNQLIAQLDAAELPAQREEAKAQLDQLIAGPRKEEIASAKADWEALVSQLELARVERERALKLFADKTLSEAERDQAVSRAATLEKSTAAAKSRYDLLLAGTRPEEIDRAKARLAELDSQLREMRIFAPTNCVLEVLSVKIGDVLSPNREVATLLLTDHLWVRVYVPQPWLGHIQLGEKVWVKVDAFPDKDFTGEVEQIGRAAEFTPRNVQTPDERIKQVFGVKVRLPSSQLRAGMSADVFFPNVPATGPSMRNF